MVLRSTGCPLFLFFCCGRLTAPAGTDPFFFEPVVDSHFEQVFLVAFSFLLLFM